ncbi:MAG: phosphate ABC transporter ATP-binding protein PstB [Gemmataceae bacterium]
MPLKSSPTHGSVPHGPQDPQKNVSHVFQIDVEKIHYGDRLAVRNVSMTVPDRGVTALIGPSGCGKSTILRSLNRMNDTIPGFRLGGTVRFHGSEIYDRHVDPVALRRHVGMVFQQPNPFAMSVFDNVAFGPRLSGVRKELPQIVESALRRAALWEELKDKLKQPATRLSGGQAQRLCIARALASEPNVLLLDEPCSALDPISTGKIEELIRELHERTSLIIVTHNLQQAKRVSDETAFFCVDSATPGRPGYLVEHGPTAGLFENPKQELTRRYVTGAFG